jgi:hypothetical protein
MFTIELYMFFDIIFSFLLSYIPLVIILVSTV